MTIKQPAWTGMVPVDDTAFALVLARNTNLKVSAKVASNHSRILRDDFRAVADAVRELVSADGPPRPGQKP